MKNTLRWMVASIILIGLLFLAAPEPSRAQAPLRWSDFENITKTTTASTYPAIAADRFGQVHVVWNEDVGGQTDNFRYGEDGAPLLDRRDMPINYLTARGNTLFYTRWNGEKWLQGIDIYTTLDGTLSFPELGVTSNGDIHLIFTKSLNERTDLMYTWSPGGTAASVQSWSKPLILATDMIAFDHPMGLAVDSLDGLHVLFFKIGVNPGVFVINSFDGGNTWSDPVMLFGTSSVTGDGDGVQPVRISSDSQGRLHAMWTRYDASGNGKAIYYSQSKNQGVTWSTPFQVAAWQPGWYEVDWLSVGVVGDKIHLVWEGGPISYNNERISTDGGLTWGPASRIMPKLVGENGWADLVPDSRGTLHQLIVKRIGAGVQIVYALWHSEYQEGQWTTPAIVGLADENFYNDVDVLSPEAVNSLLAGTINADGLRYQRSVVLNGNELFVVIVNEYDGEVYATHAEVDAPRIQPELFPTESPAPTKEPASVALSTLEPTPSVSFDKSPERSSINPGTLVIASLVPVFLIVLGLIIYSSIVHHNK